LNEIDGEVGPETWNALCSLLSSPIPTTPAASTPTTPATKQTPSGTIKPVTRNGTVRGYAGYGGGSLETILSEMRDSGRISITPEQLAIFKGVASVESSGQIQAINTWDSAIVSFGFMQWTLKYGELQKLISQIPDIFREYGIELEGQYTFGKNTVPGIKGVSNYNELRSAEWSDRFFKAGQDARSIEVETKMAIDEVNAFQNRLAKKFGTELSTHFGSPTTVSLLFELNNNRPAYVNSVVPRTLQQVGGQNLAESDFNNILRLEIVNEYVADRYNLGDDEAKGKRLSDKITNTLGV
jgi:hypothetical protein